jgi:hypothetical protein
MQRLLGSLALICVVAILLSAVLVWAQDQPQPTIVIEEMRHDMGEVFEQDRYSHVFKVKNIGNANLEIISVKPG